MRERMAAEKRDAWAGGNRCGSEKRLDEEEVAIAHNGVRDDDDDEVREPRQVGNGITNGRGGRHDVST